MKMLVFVAMVSLLIVLSGSASTGIAASGGTDGWSHASGVSDAAASANTASAVAAGGHHTCALTTLGGVECWGHNLYGQLGDGSLTSGLVAVLAGGWHSCAVTAAGGAKCWGANFFGQLGDGTTTQRPTAVDVIGLTGGVAAMATGHAHTCALITGGGLKCWGDNYRGQLGDGTWGAINNRRTPVDVVGLASGVVGVTAGGSHTCALTTTRGVKCWGDNQYGQLGDGSLPYSATPIDVPGMSSGVAAVAAGNAHTCALTTVGGVKCWGANSSGQLGDGTTNNRPTPASVTGLTSGVAALATGYAHTCALTAGGGVHCWGANNWGQLGDGTVANRTTPVKLSGQVGSGVDGLTAGGDHSCLLTVGGGIRCWGDNSSGELGFVTYYGSHSTPIEVVGLGNGVATVVAGAAHNCVLTDGGGVRCWGYYAYREGIGYGWIPTTETPITPTEVTDLSSGVAAIAAGHSHTCAVTTGGGVKCLGYNHDGQLGDGTTTYRAAPVDVSGMANGVATVAAGLRHTCALTNEGGVKCWGSNAFGELGNGTTTDSTTPVDVVGLGVDVVAIDAGGTETCAVTTQGGLKCWGDGNSVPADVTGLTSGVAAVAVGYWHACVLTTQGGVKCWGVNFFGQLGDGSLANSTTPVDVSGLSTGVVAIDAYASHTCAVTMEGSLKCWGANGNGQLGDGTAIQRTTAVDVSEMSSGVATVAVGGAVWSSLADGDTCAVSTGGGLKCWGANDVAQLGNGEARFRLTPGDVLGFEVDADGDGLLDGMDNCPAVPNVDQADTDADGVGTACDNCPETMNQDQLDTDGDGSGDACDPDDDADGTVDLDDNCPTAANPDQANDDGDSQGDLCDNCPKTPNDGQEDTDGDLAGDACDGPGSGNVDCSPSPGGVSAVDALNVLRHTAVLSVTQNEPCMDIGVGPLASGWTQGDINCSGAVNAVDALMILRIVAGLPASIPQGCPAIRPAPP